MGRNSLCFSLLVWIFIGFLPNVIPCEFLKRCLPADWLYCCEEVHDGMRSECGKCICSKSKASCCTACWETEPKGGADWVTVSWSSVNSVCGQITWFVLVGSDLRSDSKCAFGPSLDSFFKM